MSPGAGAQLAQRCAEGVLGGRDERDEATASSSYGLIVASEGMFLRRRRVGAGVSALVRPPYQQRRDAANAEHPALHLVDAS